MDIKQDILAQYIQQKEILRNFSKILSAGYDLEKLLDHFVNIVQDMLKVGRIAIALQEDGCFKIKAYRGILPDVVQRVTFPSSDGIVQYLTDEGTALRVDFAKVVDSSIVNQLRVIGATTAVPVLEHGRLRAVIMFNNKIIGVPVTDEELELIFALGSQLAVAIENANLVELISKQRNYLENILSNVSSAVISVDISGTVLTYNSKAEEILGISSAEVLGKSITNLPQDINALLKDVMSSGTPVFRKELVLSGLSKCVGVSSSTIKDNHGSVIGAVMVFTDLAPIKALEEQMRRTDRLDFVNTVAMRSSHELKNCLVSIKTFAQLLPERYADKQFREDFYLVVNKEVDRLNRVVENLLFFAQPLKLDHTSCSIDDIIQDTLDELEKEEMLEGINVQRDFKHGSSLVNIDRESMGLVLRHLIYNSIQAMPKGGEIKISTNSNDTEAGHAFEIKISDQGVGIPENVHGKIWEPFFTTKTRGIGLGLTIVRKIIEAHNGTIAIISHVNSQGTEVTVRLPQDQKKYNSARAYFPSGRTVIV